MASENAKAVAKEVIKTLGKSRKVSISKIALKKGYSKTTAKTPKNITNTKSYQNEIRPLIVRLEEARNRAVELLETKEGKAKYRDLMDGIDKLTKNIQLLSGKATENVNYIDIPYDKAKSIISGRKGSH